MATYCEYCGVEFGPDDEKLETAEGLFHKSCNDEHLGLVKKSSPGRTDKEQEDFSLGKLDRVRKAAVVLDRKMNEQGHELRVAEMKNASVGREKFGKAKRAVVGHGSHFSSPAYALAQAITDSMKPDALAPQRFVPKKRKKAKHSGPLIEYLDGKMRVKTTRYYRWDVKEVAEANPHYLLFLLSIPDGQIEDSIAKEVRKLVLANWKKK